jgi:diguanylate cyclase (GGDEF)-like protein
VGRSNTALRLTAAGVLVILLALTALSLMGVAGTRHSSDTVSRARTLADAYAAADRAVALEESLERKYRLERSIEVRAQHALAGADLNAALSVVQRIGDASDRALVGRLRRLMDTYGYQVLQVFAAVDVGDAARAAHIDATQVDPVFEQISTLVQQAADAHLAIATRTVVQLRRIQRYVFAMMVAGFALGIGLVVALLVVVHRHQQAWMRQAAQHEYAALHDALTGLPNRTLFTQRLGQALDSGPPLAVMLLDLDRFKEVNDTLGHHFGDELLQQVAGRVSEVLRDSDTVARLAGDEFAVLLPDSDVEVAREVAERILRRLHRSFPLHGAGSAPRAVSAPTAVTAAGAAGEVTVDVEASIGIAVGPGHGASVEALMRCADVAMYAAKDAKNGAVMYEPAATSHQPNRLLLLGDLRRALEQPGELVLHYQPKIGLPVGELCGVEALVRWEHPTRGLVSPADFIPVAENTGLVNLLTTHVLRQAIAQAAGWLAGGLRVPVAVNLSARCLVDPTLLERVRELLEERALPPELLRLEVTESAVMANPTLAQHTLTGLNRLGVRLSIDDYGTGYSSMAYLKRLPVDELKVDRSFVFHMTEAGNDDAILVRSAIDLGHNLGLTVVAEGVERAEHVSALRELGCDVAQGFHFARPMPPGPLLTWIREWSTAPRGKVPV